MDDVIYDQNIIFNSKYDPTKMLKLDSNCILLIPFCVTVITTRYLPAPMRLGARFINGRPNRYFSEIGSRRQNYPKRLFRSQMPHRLSEM